MVHGVTSVGGHTMTSLSAPGAQLTQDRFIQPTSQRLVGVPATVARCPFRDAQDHANVQPL